MIKKIYNLTITDGKTIEFDDEKLLSLPDLLVGQVKEQFCHQLRDIETISIIEEDISEKPVCDEVYDIRRSNGEYYLIFSNTSSGEIEDKVVVSPEELKILLYCPKHKASRIS